VAVAKGEPREIELSSPLSMFTIPE
jgi:hypothetical protein